MRAMDAETYNKYVKIRTKKRRSEWSKHEWCNNAPKFARGLKIYLNPILTHPSHIAHMRVCKLRTQQTWPSLFRVSGAFKSRGAILARTCYINNYVYAYY